MRKLSQSYGRLLPIVAGVAIVAASIPALAQAPAGAATSSLTARGSIDEAYVIGATPGDTIELLQHGTQVGTNATADSLGSVVVRNLTPGGGYSFVDTTTSTTTPKFAVLAPVGLPASDPLYNQTLHPGLNYITMRDGVQIAATVRLPLGAASLSSGPFPTVMEYSGYGTAGPADPIKVILNGANPNNPLLPDGATEVGAVVARLEGFATVSVQMRGSGCSGGAFDLFGYPSDYDGYDAIETIAHQPWVANHKVGMVGISYSGISQLEVAGTDPPNLAGITTMSPTDDLFSTGYPGGIYNNGFAAGWIADRVHDAKPALVTVSNHGKTVTPVDASVAQHWTYAEIAKEEKASRGTGSTCLANQALHAQSEQLSTLVGPSLSRDPSLFDRRSPQVWASKINVPVFLSGALQDEQTGPQWPSLITALSQDADPTHVFANMVNGDHIDSLDPATASRWLEFLDIFVANKVPTQPGLIGQAGLGFAGTGAGAKAQPAPALRFTNAPNVAAAAKKFTAKTPLVRVLFDSGASSLGPGTIAPTYTADFSSWPPAGQVTNLYLGDGGQLSTTQPNAETSASFTPDPGARPTTSMGSGGNGIWSAQPNYNWTTVPSANGIAFETSAFASDTTIVGPASLDLQLKSTNPVSDLQVTVTEVRPGDQPKEEYVTSGFLETSNRTLTAASTVLDPIPTFLAADKQEDLSPSSYTTVRIPIDPIAHTFRAGTKLRIVISAPGGDRPSWTFQDLVPTANPYTDTVDLGGATLSKLVVNEVSGVTAPAALPACNSLRGEPCRDYTQLNNHSVG